MNGERIVKEYLISYFYEPLKSIGMINGYENITDIERQYKGIDTILSCNGGEKLKIDEKCALSYVNSNLSTFAFEICYLNQNGERTEGWLVDKTKETDYYYTIWLKGSPIVDEHTGKQLKKYGYIRRMTVDHLTHVELYAISKEKLLDFLCKSFKLSADAMKKEAARLIDNGIKQSIVNEKIKYYYSMSLAEKPVNLVIGKEILRQIADATYEITHDGIKSGGNIIYKAQSNTQ